MPMTAEAVDARRKAPQAVHQTVLPPVVIVLDDHEACDVPMTAEAVDARRKASSVRCASSRRCTKRCCCQ